MKEQWKIGEFASKIGRHANTIDQWFKKLEELNIHYVNRLPSTNEKIYDDLDLKIALHIKSERLKFVKLTI
nr:hypothetical protein [Neobacillus sp. Marseille-Q6967]